MKTYNFCLLFGFNRKDLLKSLHYLIEKGYGPFNDLINMTILELSEIEKVIISIEQQETLSNAGF